MDFDFGHVLRAPGNLYAAGDLYACVLAAVTLRERLEAALAAGQDTALLRFSLGDLLAKSGELDAACDHLRRAVELNPDYSAAWKLLGRTEAQAGHVSEARQSLSRGLAVAQAQGDKQAEREMMVFLKRLNR